MRARLIVNPVSGTDTAPDYLQAINQRLRPVLGDLDIVMTTAAGDGAKAAMEAVRDGRNTLLVAGGDGTLNEVLNGAASMGAAALAGCTFGMIPLGTGNDFAHGLGVPEDVDGALTVIEQAQTLTVDVGTLGDRFFVNVSAGGFIAEVSEAVNPQLKSVTGKLAYLIGGAQVLTHFVPVNASARVTAPDGTHEFNADLTLFAVCNSRKVGGGRLIAPYALMDDGLLDVCLVREMPTLEFVGLLSRVASGEHVDDPRVMYFRASALDLDFDRPVKVNTDGEVLETTACRYRVITHGTRFFAGTGAYALAAGASGTPSVPEER